ncbi:MAG: hypothetical protein ACLTCQ_27945 [Enterocloster bolteae]
MEGAAYSLMDGISVLRELDYSFRRLRTLWGRSKGKSVEGHYSRHIWSCRVDRSK